MEKEGERIRDQPVTLTLLRLRRSHGGSWLGGIGCCLVSRLLGSYRSWSRRSSIARHLHAVTHRSLRVGVPVAVAVLLRHVGVNSN